MAPDLGGWIHNFTVTDTQTHKGGYTLYKITSIVFPRSVPQALTQIVVWRRFHDVKRLHRDLKRRHKSLQLPGYLPEPIDCSFFKRFDKDVIQKRKEYILQLLDYAAQHPALYKCHAFAQFFNETTPPNKIQTLVHKAVRGLNKNFELLQDQVDFSRKELEDDKTNSTKNDEQQQHYENHANAQEEKSLAEKEKAEEEKGDEEDDESLKVEYTSNVNNHPKHFLTPMASIESDDSDYIYEAALEFSQAVQAEANLEYTEAHTRYKRGVDILLYGSKDDSNEERKFIAKAKISKYLARADDIHDRFLKTSHRSLTSSPKNNFQLAIDVSGNTASDSSGLYLERPWNHMAKYKVNRLLGNKVLHVTCITEPLKPSYVMKGIEKPSSNSPTQTVFLPQHVPYMVDLLAFFQSDQKIFLLLKLALGGRLIDYVHSINDGTMLFANRFGEINVSDKSLTRNNETEFNDLLNNSKQLLKSVSNTLQVIKDLDSPGKSPRKSPRRSPRKMPSFHSKIPESQLKIWSQQLLIAIHALHEKSVILSDLNMDNLLLNENGQLLLTYFYQNEGVSSDSCIHKALSPKALDEHFVAPERPLTLRSDWWSYGVILYELFLGLPFKAAHPGQIDLYGFVQYPENAEISDDAKDLLEKLLQQSPEDRLDYEKIKQHRFFEGTNWDEVKHNGYNHSTQK